MIVKGTTRVALILGHPIAQVRSPDLFNAWFAANGVDGVLVPVDLAPERVAGFLDAMRGWHDLAGCIVTVPHKGAVAARLDALTDRARRLGAANVVRRDEDGTLRGDMVDGLGFAAAAASHGFRPAGARALVVGAGGAGSAIADALCEGGVAELALADADAARAEWLRGSLAATFPAVRLTRWEGDDLSGYGLVVNATPVGMGGTGEMPLPPAAVATLRPGTFVADVVTKPEMAPLLLAARARGCRAQTGPEMTAGQMEALGRHLGLMP